MTRNHRPLNRTRAPPWARHRTPSPWLALLLAAAVPAAVYLLTHPVAAALLAGAVAGRLSAPLVARLRRLADAMRADPLRGRLAAARRSAD